MLPYLLLIFVPFLFALTEVLCFKYNERGFRHRKRTIQIYSYKNRMILSYLLMLMFVIIIGTTDGNGLDWHPPYGGYAGIDYSKIDIFDDSSFEAGFVILNQIAGNFNLFLLIMAIGCFFIAMKVLKQDSPYLLVSLFIFIASNSLYQFMGVYRHAIAQTIVMLLWIIRDNRKKQLLVILAAMTFHMAAVVALLYLFIPYRKAFNKKQIFLLLLIGIIIRFSLVYIMPILMTLAFGPVADKLAYYADTEGSDGSFGLNYFIFRCFIVLMGYLFINRRNKDHVFYFNTYVVSVAIYLALTMSATFYRLSMFFSTVEVILIPIVINEIRKKWIYNANYIFFFLIISTLYIYLFFGSLQRGLYIYVPYKSIIFI